MQMLRLYLAESQLKRIFEDVIFDGLGWASLRLLCDPSLVDFVQLT